MFERYTEAARRALFFARFETSEHGARAIETEHVLLGITRVSAGIGGRILAASNLTFASLAAEIDRRIAKGERIPASTEIPFSDETKHVLRYAMEEADGLRHSYIGTEHLLLGLLREQRGMAASILSAAGLTVAAARTQILAMARQTVELRPAPRSAVESVRVDADVIIQRIHL